MKRKLLLTLVLAFLILMALTVSVFAEENVPAVDKTYYLVQEKYSDAESLVLGATAQKLVDSGISADNILSADELFDSTQQTNAIFSSVTKETHLEFILAESIKTTGCVTIASNSLPYKVTATIKYNGFTHFDSGSNNVGSAFLVRDDNFYLRFIGTKARDEGGKVTNHENTADYNQMTGNVDLMHKDKVYAWLFEGSVYAENIRAKTIQEFIYSESGAGSSTRSTFEIVDCALYADSYALGFQGQGAYPKVVKVEGSYINGLDAQTVLSGSYVKNSVITGNGVKMDCWDISGQLWEFENSSISSVITYSGRTHLQFTDCTFDLSKISLGADGGGKCCLYVITTPNCERAGSKITYQNGNMSGNVDTAYAEANPKTGHSKIGDAIALVYKNGFDKNGFYTFNCSVCKKQYEDESAIPVIIFKGYSVPESTSVKGINAGYKIDKEMLYLYNELNETDASLTLFMVNSANLSQILEGDTLELAEGVKGINVKITSTSYTDISVEVRGFALKDAEGNQGNFYTLNLITAIAVKTEDGVHYVQAGLKTVANDTVKVGEDTFNVVSAEDVYTAIS